MHVMIAPSDVAPIPVWVTRALVSVTLLMSLGIASAAESLRTTGDTAVYLGVLPAAMVRGHSPEHSEGAMHGGIPAGKHQNHVVISMFDARTGMRIDSAEVSARVGPLGMAGTKKRLERMLIANTVSYGNYFEMGGAAPYRIEVEIRRPGMRAALQVRFDYTPPQP